MSANRHVRRIGQAGAVNFGGRLKTSMQGCREKRQEVEEAVGDVAQDEEWRRQGASVGQTASA